MRFTWDVFVVDSFGYICGDLLGHICVRFMYIMYRRQADLVAF